MIQLNAYLTFDGTCAEAMRFYERTLGGKIEMMMTHGESPIADQVPPGSAERIMHARLAVDGHIIMASDAMVGQPYSGMHGFSLALAYPSASEALRIFDALAEGGKVGMPIQKTFWAEAFGMLVDRFGTPWLVNGAMTQP
ncbi:MAG TPA: VOC family protein [Paraburkholderia sp.]|jgi:PhnB protein|nr:VOC family protein [Paraburkholderia sp.]